MNKTVNINLSGIIFHIEEDAYNKLHSYLSTIKGYFSESEGRAWQLLSSAGLNNAYSDDEPDYPLNLIKEENSDYEGR